MSSPETTTTTYLAAPRPRRSYPTRLSLPLSQSPSPSPSPSPSTPFEQLGRSTSPGDMNIDKSTGTLLFSSSSSFEGDVEEECVEGEVDRSRLRPRRVHVATTPSPSRRSVPLPPSPSPTPGPSAHNSTNSAHHKQPKSRPISTTASVLRLPRLLRHRLTLSADMDVYDTLIALSFALCLVLFLRALTGSGPESDAGHAYALAGHQRQAHPAYAPSQAELHRRAGTFCSVPGPISSSASTTHEHDGARIHAHRPHHRTGVPPDPHAHASVDPEGSWSYALDHHLPHLHLHEHDAHGWNGLAKRLMRVLGMGKMAPEETKASDGFGMEEEEEDSRDIPEPETLGDPHLDDSDPAYPLRVHLPSSPSAEAEKGARDVLTKHKHRKARGRGLVQMRL